MRYDILVYKIGNMTNICYDQGIFVQASKVDWLYTEGV